jgi:hypothetical protein
MGIRFDDDVLAGLQLVYDRDGILPSEQVRRAVREWLQARGVKLVVKGAAASEGALRVARSASRSRSK